MSDRKFTPGPWDLMAGMPTNVLAHSGIRVARCDFDGDFDHPECVANARLIAVAPELYEALKNLVAATEAADNVRDMGVGSDEPVVEQALAALAKAEAPNE